MAPTAQQLTSMKRAEKLVKSSSNGGTKKTTTTTKKTKARVERYLKKTGSQLKEVRKSVLLFQGMKCSSNMTALLKELRAMQAPAAKLLSKKNPIVAFDNGQSIEFLCTKNDCALFALASHNKKRPNHVVLGRTFDHHVLDMAELAVCNFKSMHDYGGTVPKKRIGSKPLLLFVGDLWQQQTEYKNLQNLLTDFYRGDVVDKVVLSGVDHLIMFAISQQPQQQQPNNPNRATTTTTLPFIHQRTYFCKLKKNPNAAAGAAEASSSPLPYLEPCGPDLDFQLRRTQWAEPDLYRAARKLPSSSLTHKQNKKNNNKSKSLAANKTKNLATNVFGETVGRLHLEKQNVAALQGRKVKALRRAEQFVAAQEREALEKELQAEQAQEDAAAAL